MGKILKIVAGIALAAMAFVPGLNILSLSSTMLASVGAIGVSLALTGVSEAFLGPSMPKSQLSRLNVSLDTTTPRKAVFGTTAMNLDLRYHEASGTDQEYIDYVIALAAHRVKSIDEIWFEEKQAWTATGGVTSTYSGYLTVQTLNEGGPSNYLTVNSGTRWGASQTMTGCAQVKIRVKRSGNTNEAESPLLSGMPSRVTIIGNGAPLYDPRKDSTVPGGDGFHTVSNQGTWGNYTNDDDCDNPALQLLWWLLGWKINGELSVGCGIPANRIDMESFITAANICDENVTLATGGTQKRYRTSGTATDADDRMAVISSFLSCMNGSLRDCGGKLSLTVIKNDLADYVLSFDEGDVLNEFEWNQTRGLTDTYTKVRGRYVDPSNNSLYQLVDYPSIEVDGGPLDGIERVMTLDLPFVEDGRRAQRIAKQVLQRNQYKGMFSATFSAKAQGCTVGDVVRLTFPALGWTNKLFRVVSQEIRFDGQVPLSLIEENSAIYSWDAEDATPVNPNAPTIYDPLNNPIIKGIDNAGTSGLNSASVFLYKRATSTPAVPSTTLTYTFSTGVLSGTLDGWTQTIPSGSDPIYVTLATASSTSTTDTIATTEWASPTILAQNGTNGTNGLNNAIVYLYQRLATTPSSPSGTFTYTFSTGVLSGGTPGSWTQTIPAVNGNPLWVIAATASSNTSTDTIAAAEFSSPSKLVQDGTNGTNGTNGADGLSVAATVPIMNIACTFNGTPKSGEIPRSTQMIVYYGNTNVSSSATYSVSTSGCSVTNNGAGSFTLDSVASDGAYFTVTATYSSRSISMRIPVPKVKDGSSSSSASGSVGINNSSSYSGTQSGPYTLPVGPNGTITMNAAVNYYVNSGSATLYGKWQYRTTPGSGSWTDIGTETAGDPAFLNEPAGLFVTSTLGGPASPTNWEFQFVNRKTGSGTALDNGGSTASLTWSP